MKKEMIICIFIVIVIVIANIVTQNYTTKTVGELNSKLEALETEITDIGENEDIAKDSVKNKIEEVEKYWEDVHSKLAYYIEHDELEKVETDIVGINSSIETNDYEQVLSKIDESKFILRHIEDKYAFTLENVF